ncbi:MAG: T9SS type A sorting domain-containing protein [Siphonobacter sp.]
MKHTILFLFGITLLLTLLGAEQAAAQSEPKRSRLDIKPKAKTTTRLSPFVLAKTQATREVKLNRSTAVNEYFRTIARQGTKQKTNEQSVASASTELSRVEEDTNLNIDRMYISDKISVSNLYPNPANDYVYIDYNLSSDVTNAKITLYSPLGMQMGDFTLDRSEHRHKITVANLPNNMYFYQLSIEGKTLATKKLLVRHQ